MSVEAKLTDGPLDGQSVTLDGDPIDPPREHLPLHVTESGVARKLIYRRGANPNDSGPAHLYYYEGVA